MAKESRFTIDDTFFQSIKIFLNPVIPSNDIIQYALSLFQWAVGEIRQGNKIGSLDKDDVLHEITMPFQSNIVVQSYEERRDQTNDNERESASNENFDQLVDKMLDILDRDNKQFSQHLNLYEELRAIRKKKT